MFVSIDCIDEDGDLYYYRLTDELFESEHTFSTNDVDFMPNSSTTVRILVILEAYRDRLIAFPEEKHNVAQYIANYYTARWQFFPHQIAKVSLDRDYIDHRYPTFQYGKKYYDCVIRQIKQANFSNRKFVYLGE